MYQSHCPQPSFSEIFSGLLEDFPSGVDPDAECCDVRWDLKVDNRSRGTLKRTHPPCQHRNSLSSSAACRLCNSRLKLCLLVLVLLHTVASLTASHNATGLGLPTIAPLEDSPANEEWRSCQAGGLFCGDGGEIPHHGNRCGKILQRLCEWLALCACRHSATQRGKYETLWRDRRFQSIKAKK